MMKLDTAAREPTLGVDGLVRFFVFVALVVALPWFVISGSPDGDRNNIWIPCLLIAAWSGTRLAWLIAAGIPRLFEFSFWLYCYLFMGIAPAAQIHSDQMAGTTPGLQPSQDAATVVVVIIGIAAFELGVLSSSGRKSRRVEQEAAETSPSAAASSVSRSLVLLAAVVPVALYFITAIGPANFFTNRFDFADVASSKFDGSVLALLRALSWVPAMVVLHRIISRRRAQPGAKLNGGELIGVAASVALVVFANNPLTSSRYAFGSMALSLAVLLGGCATVARTRRTMLVLVLGFLVVFPLADTFRRAERADVKPSLFDEYSGNADYDSFGQISNSITVVEDEGFSYLRQPLGVISFWVPRSVWEEKPIDTGEYIAEARGYQYTNLSAPLWAEFFVVGGHFTVAIGFFALGFVVVLADRRLIQGLRGDRSYSVAGAFMPFYLIILLRGSLLQAAALAAALFASVWFTRPVAMRAESDVDGSKLESSGASPETRRSTPSISLGADGSTDA